MFVEGEHHCDEYIKRPDAPECLVEFVKFYRQPAGGRSGETYPDIYATLLEAKDYEVPDKFFCRVSKETATIPAGTRVRLTMASRFGDVGVTPFEAHEQRGYVARVTLDKLSNFSAQK